MKRIKWWIYTVLFGSIPFAIRLFLWVVLQDTPDYYFYNEVDIVTFGLVLLMGNLAELDEQPAFTRPLKVGLRGLLIFALVIQSGCLGISYCVELFGEKVFQKSSIKLVSTIFSATSLIMSLGIYYHPGFDNDEN